MSRKLTSKNADERRAWIRYQLRVNGSSFAEIARELQLSRQAVWEGSVNPTLRIAEAIATKLGKKPRHLWPNRYAA